MSDVVGAARFAQRRADITRPEREAEARAMFDRMTEHMAAQLEAGKCCTILETGNHPEDDWHLCLRTKGHKGSHMDKITGLNWKWEAPE